MHAYGVLKRTKATNEGHGLWKRQQLVLQKRNLEPRNKALIFAFFLRISWEQFEFMFREMFHLIAFFCQLGPPLIPLLGTNSMLLDMNFIPK